MKNKRASGKAARRSRPLLERVNANAAGIDCGSDMHYVAVPADRDAESVRCFKTFTVDLHRLADWVLSCGVKTVAMEATGVYWIPIYEILEARGLARERPSREECAGERATSATANGCGNYTASGY